MEARRRGRRHGDHPVAGLAVGLQQAAVGQGLPCQSHTDTDTHTHTHTDRHTHTHTHTTIMSPAVPDGAVRGTPPLHL